MATVIRFEAVSKRYRLGAGHTSLREALSTLPGRLLGRRQDDQPGGELWALKDVSFQVDRGQVLGFIGPNGAGKTTTLKLLSRVVRPTNGCIETVGRVSALIELGAGFHPDLTGRENIFLNGVILGLSRAEIARKLDSIVSFAGLEEFIDTPVKRYSSGMYVRLGFAVAAHVEPEILLVDEVLAVGDHQFRVKCIDRFRELQAEGVTTVIVSHNRHLVESMCSRVIYLNRGQVVYDGDPGAAWDAYLSTSAADRLGLVDVEDDEAGEAAMAITGVEVLDARGVPSLYFGPGEPARACIEFEVHAPVENPVFYARLYRDGNLVHGTNTARFQLEGTYQPGDRGVAIIDYQALNLLEGAYELSVGIEKSFFSRASFDRAPSIHITVGGGLRYGVGLVHLEHRWQVERAGPRDDDGLADGQQMEAA
jgi:lipopolysaccharide transport system ATP-binding protein